MTDLVMQSIDTLSLIDFRPIPVAALKSRCEQMTQRVDFFYWWRWHAGRKALLSESHVQAFTEHELLRFIGMMIREDAECPGMFEHYCRNGALRAALVELAVRTEAA